MMSVAFSYCYAECHYDEFHYVECHYDECHYYECHCLHAVCGYMHRLTLKTFLRLYVQLQPNKLAHMPALNHACSGCHMQAYTLAYVATVINS